MAFRLVASVVSLFKFNCTSNKNVIGHRNGQSVKSMQANKIGISVELIGWVFLTNCISYYTHSYMCMVNCWLAMYSA